jgi:P27 family predicted phage terminase small subunit
MIMAAKRGPKPKPTALRMLHGDKPSRYNNQEPIPAPGLPQCPGEVTLEVQEVWDFTIEQLQAMDCVALADRDMLRVYCEAVILHRHASADIAAVQVFDEPGTDAVVNKLSRLARIQKTAAETMRQYGSLFGLNPSARSQIKVGEKAGDTSGAERFLSA